MEDVKEEKIVRYRDKNGKFTFPIKKNPHEKETPKTWYRDLPDKKQTTEL